MTPVKTVIPYKPENPKSRLSAVFSKSERKQFVELSLENVLLRLKETGMECIEIIAKSPLHPNDEKKIQSIFSGSNINIIISVDERDLNTALNDYLKKSDCSILIVMADLALITAENIAAMIRPSLKKEHPKNGKFVRIAPGKDGGTNMLFIETPKIFEVNYYGESFKKHKMEAEKKKLECEIYESYFAAADMDEPEDLKDILTYGKGEL